MTYANGNHVMAILNGKKINITAIFGNYKLADAYNFVTADGEVFCVAEV
jgi:hypothetical protein